ncbi:uncharacterized protein LOC119362148 isoform X2 [Triticum dicoccoides]|uniref:uncharacterized protein LOC119362148 isoform X2 n=1 Tax=Triticum dicoccoides TaxID=85692 RepID=UPI00188E427B|nr:uncharacterized protein LOC119362148 isoform X2 [Triticum dicoccoides]
MKWSLITQLSYQQVLKGSTCPTMLRGCHIVNSVCHADHDVLPHGVMTPELGQHAGSRTSTGWTSRTPGATAVWRRWRGEERLGSKAGRGRTCTGVEDIAATRAARRIEDIHLVEDVADTRGDGGAATMAGRGEVGQQGVSRKDVHQGGGHRDHQGLGRHGDGGGAGRGRAAKQVEDVR